MNLLQNNSTDGTQFSGIIDLNSVVKLCFFHLRQLRLIRRSLTNDTTRALVRAFVHSRLDYCNGVLAGLPINQVTRLQLILCAAVMLVLRLPSWASVTDPMRDDLHWLDDSKHIIFKYCVLAFKCHCETGLAASYLASSCVFSSTVPSCVDLRSANRNTMLISWSKDKKRLGPEVSSTPAAHSCMEQSPQCSYNLRPIATCFQEKLDFKINFLLYSV